MSPAEFVAARGSDLLRASRETLDAGIIDVALAMPRAYLRRVSILAIVAALAYAPLPEIGGGAKTVLAQTAAEALGVGIDRITIAPYDTSNTPGASGVYGSRITVLMGNAVKRVPCARAQR